MGETVIDNFGPPNGKVDGTFPIGTLAAGTVGVLYGTTQLGGAYGGGTVYQLTAPAGGGAWTETILHSFYTEGSDPNDGVLVTASGALYGTTLFGGTGQYGTAFKLTPPAVSGDPWTETTLATFTGANGAYPEAGLLLIKGTLYGTTTYGGVSDYGTVFKLF